MLLGVVLTALVLVVGSGVILFTSASPAWSGLTHTQSVTRELAKTGLPGLLPVHLDELEVSRFLELINIEYSVENELDPDLLVNARTSVPTGGQDEWLHYRALQAMAELCTAARAEGIATVYVRSGYRSYDNQEQLYWEAEDKSFVQPAGHSEHQTGLAADIFPIARSEREEQQAVRWLAANSWRFGLILRYTEAKRRITGIAGEPWHFRYVGLPHSWYMFRYDLTLEEYIESLRQSGGYVVSLEGREYTVAYAMPQDGFILLPEGLDFDISRDNTGGYIATSGE
ncbi:MAG: M15 family metallopeptidase [Symbiobacteriaceae bacterium]|nr:M15 family metallopeptidase [Symbiobacteriaceae bacterium]